MAAPIRVWLEPGYDGGRVGAWMLDLPGCFVWGASREVALARVPSAVGAFAARFADHGETVAGPETDEIEIVAEVPVSTEAGHERYATFEADRRPVPADEFEAVLRRLGFARDDLLAFERRLDLAAADEASPAAAAARGDGGDGGDAGRTERNAGEILRHVAATEVWLAGRLRPGDRYDGPSHLGDLRDYLEGSREWAIAEVRAIYAADPAAAGTDRRGETWTLAKVLRRLLYHSLDHLGELDRRLARAEGAVERLVVRKDVLVDPDRLAELFRAVGWYRRVADRARLARMLEGSTQIVSAWDGDRMVGFARAISDDAFNGYIGSVAVHPRWQGKGLGQRLIRELLEGNDQVRFIISAVPGLEGFYGGLGFRRQPYAMSRDRLE